ncbi:Putative peptidoglycan binding domain-containing protein [Methylobacterium sp. ap11]|uniref:peptidoglycan-binding domain-containing protein n=1 Tax=Methylobacterium sp. ap11 TaxID=1761799 RepID=UPI0008D15C8E|nr:peptidoglycan-binding domain-containing protein [Methylobacterium sp. ap11]SEP34722.1 Putative peptidoglycan binding domain-containing protein [Methylobacterium sp. ap11]
MSEAPARRRDGALDRRRDAAPPRRAADAPARRPDPDVAPAGEAAAEPALTADARPAPRVRTTPRAPRPVRSAPRPAGALDRIRGRADRILRHPAGIVGGLLALGAVAAVAANALSFQTGRHPAPLFAKASPDKALSDGKGSAGKDTAGKEPAGKTPADRTAPDTRAAQAAGEASPRAAKPDVSKPDGIGALLRDDRTTASLGPKADPARSAKAPHGKETAGREGQGREASGKAASHAPVREARAPEPKASALHAAAPATGLKPDRSVAYAQRALIKLGYGPLTVDGIAGPTTRAALARFERERRLPGASVARRTLQELEARSGLKPE